MGTSQCLLCALPLVPLAGWQSGTERTRAAPHTRPSCTVDDRVTTRSMQDDACDRDRETPILHFFTILNFGIGRYQPWYQLHVVTHVTKAYPCALRIYSRYVTWDVSKLCRQQISNLAVTMRSY